MTFVTFTAHLPLNLADKVDQVAARQRITHDAIAQQALQTWLEREEARYRMTLEALADVDSGRVVSHDAIDAPIRERLGPVLAGRSHRREGEVM